MATITSLKIQGYRPFGDFTATLRPLEIIVGANGSGKSALFEFLKFLRDSTYTSHGHKVDFFEALKTKGEECVQSGFVNGRGILQAGGDGGLESWEVSVVMRIQALFAHKLPEAFN